MLFILVDINPADENLPEHVPYILIGAGTASFAACRAIKKEKPDAKVDWKIHFTIHISISWVFISYNDIIKEKLLEMNN